jgi:hypothetical protein
VIRRPKCFALLTFPLTFLQRLGGLQALSLCEFGIPYEDATQSFAEQMPLATHACAATQCIPESAMSWYRIAAARRRGLLHCSLRRNAIPHGIDSPLSALWCLSDTPRHWAHMTETAAFFGSDFTVLGTRGILVLVSFSFELGTARVGSLFDSLPGLPPSSGPPNNSLNFFYSLFKVFFTKNCLQTSKFKTRCFRYSI